MHRQILKPSNQSSPRNHEFLEPPRTPPLAVDIRSKQNDDVGSHRFSFGDLRSFYRELCVEEMAKFSPIASIQSESPGFIFPPRRAVQLSADSAFTSASASPSAPAADGASSSPASTIPSAVEAEEIGESERDVVVIVTYSRSPCEDFRRSMEEMVAARVVSRGEVDQEFMEELLFRYLELNNNKFFRDILHAFLELIGDLHEDSGKTPPPRRRRWSGGFSKKKLKLEIKNMRKLCCKYRC